MFDLNMINSHEFNIRSNIFDVDAIDIYCLKMDTSEFEEITLMFLIMLLI